MRSAETIIREYLERGYSLEGLRVLAESRSEPLCSEMLAILEGMERRNAPGIPREATAGEDERIVFFVAEEEQVEVETVGVDFDILAEAAPAEASDTQTACIEESIAEITIGETEGASIVSFTPENPGGKRPETKAKREAGIWSRLWNAGRNSTEKDAEPQPPALCGNATAPGENEQPDILAEIGPPRECHDSPAATGGKKSAPSEISGDYLPDAQSSVEESADSIRAIGFASGSVAPETVLEGEKETSDVETSEFHETAEPGPDAAASPEEPAATASSEEPARIISLPGLSLPGALVPGEAGKSESRREKRRRERAQKKKKKLQAKKEALLEENSLPEIVLARSEETDTMTPEAREAQSPGDMLLDMDAPALAYEPAAPDGEKPVLSLLPPSPPDAGDRSTFHGGMDLRSDAFMLLREDPEVLDEDAHDYDPDGVEESGSNVILFRNALSRQDPDGEADGETEDFGAHPPLLRMLPLDEGGLEEEAETAGGENEGHREAPALGETGLSPDDRLEILKAFVGTPGAAETSSTTADSPDRDHVIVRQEVEPIDQAAEAEEVRKSIEAEYQERLDEFAKRLLEVQAVAAANETLMRERANEVKQRDDELAAVRRLRAEEEAKSADLSRELADARSDVMRKQVKLDGFGKILEEHERLYAEFEDLRKAYNEVVVEVMPTLQNERDDLALTVERQCEFQDRLRSSLGSARRRLAVGYSLGAAASLMLVALPLFNWLRSDDGSRSLAMDHQKATELHERLNKAEMRNVQYEKDLFELKQNASMQLADLEAKNRELAKLADSRTGRSASGTPTRTSAMVGPAARNNNGRLAVNEVRDPAGQIDDTVAMNRGRYGSPASNNSSRIPVSAVAQSQPSANAAGLRPPAGNAAPGGTPSRTASGTQTASATLNPGSVAKVKAGEGVAQVVYRVLGTRDPAVINWVIRENNIRKDRRGNPIIHPNQELRLPPDGGTTQTASASRR